MFRKCTLFKYLRYLSQSMHNPTALQVGWLYVLRGAV